MRILALILLVFSAGAAGANVVDFRFEGDQIELPGGRCWGAKPSDPQPTPEHSTGFPYGSCNYGQAHRDGEFIYGSSALSRSEYPPLYIEPDVGGWKSVILREGPVRQFGVLGMNIAAYMWGLVDRYGNPIPLGNAPNVEFNGYRKGELIATLQILGNPGDYVWVDFAGLFRKVDRFEIVTLFPGTPYHFVLPDEVSPERFPEGSAICVSYFDHCSAIHSDRATLLAPVPVPAAAWLLGGGIAALGMLRRRRGRRKRT